MNNSLGVGNLAFNLFGGLADFLSEPIRFLIAMFYKGIYMMWAEVARILDCIQILFQMFVGIVPVVYKSNSLFANSGNLVVDIIMHPFIYGAFIKLLIISFFLLIIFTFVAVIKTEYSTATSDSKGNSKGQIIGKSLKAFFSFFLIPMVCIVGVIASTFVLRALDYATSPSTTTIISNKLFVSCAYGCNRARSDKDFYNVLANNVSVSGYSIDNKLKPEVNFTSAEAFADAIDKAFETGLPISKFYVSDTLSAGDEFDNYIDSAWFLHDNGITNDTYFNTKNSSMVFYFYNLKNFSWLLAIFSIFFLAGILISITLGAAVRLYELAILFIISPAVISIMPLDDNPFKTWKKKFIGKTAMIFAPVVALNLYFILVDTLLQIDISATLSTAINSGMADVMADAMSTLINGAGGLISGVFDLFIIIAGSMVCKEAIKWLGDMIGAEDMMGAGDKLKKGVSDFVKTNAALAVGAGAAKMVAGGAKNRINNGVGRLSEKHGNFKSGAAQRQAARNARAESDAATDANAIKNEKESGKLDEMTDFEKQATAFQAFNFGDENDIDMAAASKEYELAYKASMRSNGGDHEAAKQAAVASVMSNGFGSKLDEAGKAEFATHLHGLDKVRRANMTSEERKVAMGQISQSNKDAARELQSERFRAINSGDTENEILEDINKDLANLDAALEEAEQTYNRNKQFMSESEFKDWETKMGGEKYARYGGEENYLLSQKRADTNKYTEGKAERAERKKKHKEIKKNIGDIIHKNSEARSKLKQSERDHNISNRDRDIDYNNHRP